MRCAWKDFFLIEPPFTFVSPLSYFCIREPVEKTRIKKKNKYWKEYLLLYAIYTYDGLRLTRDG